MTLEEKFNESWTPEPNTGCHLWTKGITGAGYPNFWDGSHKLGAHRFAWSLVNGPIPKGLQICHRCDTPLCVNPAHLFLGTHKDSAVDSIRKNRQAGGERNPNARLTVANVVEIRQTNTKAAILAEKFGVKVNTVAAIRGGRGWKSALASLPEASPARRRF